VGVTYCLTHVGVVPINCRFLATSLLWAFC
jgi:hypothetical protein